MHYFKNPLVYNAYKLHTRLKHYDLLEILQKLDKSQYLSPQELHQLRLTRLRELIKIAYSKSPFWKNRFDSIGLTTGDIDRLESLEDFPILTKQDVINQRDEIVVNHIEREKLFLNKSGGTTGSPLSYYLDQRKFDVVDASTLRHNFWAGSKIGLKSALIWGADRDVIPAKSWKTRLKEKLFGLQIYLNSSDISEKNLQEFIADWKQIHPDILTGYASGLKLFADYLKDNRLEIPAPRAIISSAETLTPSMRETVETVLKARVFERYGCREVSLIASECEAFDGMHVNAENLFLEYVTVGKDEDGNNLDRLLITDLENRVFPFIRYQIGDFVVRKTEQKPCPCGRSLPKIQGIQGRLTDFLRTRDGRYISGPWLGLAINLRSQAQGIMKTQFVQKSFENITLRIVKGNNFDDKSIKALTAELNRILGDSIQIDFEFPDKIDRESSGKYRLVISEITD